MKGLQPHRITLTRGNARYGISVDEQACVVRKVTNEDTAGRRTLFRAFVRTHWTRINGYRPLFFDHYKVGARLENGGGNPAGDPNLRTHSCDLAKHINSQSSGQADCATAWVMINQLPKRFRKGPKSGDGNVVYDTDVDKKIDRDATRLVTPSWSGLHGSPLMG